MDCNVKIKKMAFVEALNDSLVFDCSLYEEMCSELAKKFIVHIKDGYFDFEILSEFIHVHDHVCRMAFYISEPGFKSVDVLFKDGSFGTPFDILEVYDDAYSFFSVISFLVRMYVTRTSFSCEYIQHCFVIKS